MDPEKIRIIELIDRFKSGEKGCFDELVVQLSPKLFRVAYGLLGNREDAEEVVQDAFVRAYKALPDFRGDASFETWMHRITVNLSHNRYHWNERRGEKVNLSLSAPLEDDDNSMREMELPDTRLEPDRQLEHRELESNIMSALQQLPETLREPMVLRHLGDMSYEEIADMLDCKTGTIKSRLARGRMLVRDYFAGIESGKGVAADNE